MDRIALLERLVDSYAGPSPVNALHTHRLPNRREVLVALEHLQHVLFLGFWTTGRPDRATLTGDLGAHLDAAATLLQRQIGRAVAWTDRSDADDVARCDGWCATAVDAFLEQLPAIRERLVEDAHAMYDGDPAAESVEEVVFSYLGFRALSIHRLANALYHLDVPFIPRILSEHAHAVTGIDLHPGATIGRRLCIDHGTGVVIGQTAVLGDNVRLYQGVTLGALSIPLDLPRGRTPPKRHPTLEDGVVVYAGATILGGETVVGARSVIGGNVWLIRSVPPDSRVRYEEKP